MSLGKMFEESCCRYAERIAIIHEGERLTYRELDRNVNAVGNQLKKLGLEKEDKIAVMLPNCPEFIISYFAIQKIGAVAVTLNVMSTSYELHHFLGNSDAKALITNSPLAKKYEDIDKKLPQCRHLIIADSTTDDSIFRQAVREGPFTLEIPEMSGDDPAVMIYTSGLTSLSLGAVLTHRNLLFQSVLVRDICGGTEADIGLSIIPLFHSFGAVANMLGTIRMGGGLVLMERFTLDGIMGVIDREKVTYIAAVPRVFLGMLFHNKSDNLNLSSLRLCITGGAAMPPEFIPEFEKKFKVKIMEGYGLTEAAPACSFSRLDMPQKPGSIGVALPGVEAKVFDEHDKELLTGEVGELVVRGENVMKGYYRNEEATASVIRNGWLHTGDLAKIDEAGYIFITGRKKRMIITNAFNVYPREVEKVLEFHPAVRSAKVIGKGDLMRGEIVKALVIKHDNASVDEKDLVKHCRTYLSSFKVPREIEFVQDFQES